MYSQIEEYKISAYLDKEQSYNGVRVLQVGRYYCNPGRVIEAHLHSDFLELTIVTDGEGTIITNNKPESVKSGDIYLSLPLDKHEIHSSTTNPLKYDHIAFFIEDENFYDDIDFIIRNFINPKQRIIYDNRISRLTTMVLSEFNSGGEHKNEVISSLLKTIIVYIIRDFKNKEKVDSLENVSSREVLCTQIMNYIDLNIFDIDSLTIISDVLKYNYSYLSTMFKSVTKISLREYFLNRKLEVAKSLISENKLKIYEIAEKLGYSSPNAFTKAFKDKYGYPPKSKTKQK